MWRQEMWRQDDADHFLRCLRCVKCGNTFKGSEPQRACSGCGSNLQILSERLFDLLGDDLGQAQAILEWPASGLESEWKKFDALSQKENGSPIIDPELSCLGVLTSSGQLTELGAKLAYHVAEHRIQKDDSEWLGLLDRAGFDKEARVLDVGCGAGQTLRLLQKRTRCLGVGLDTDLEALAFGSRWAQFEGKCVWFVRATSDRLPFPDGWFTHVICRVGLNYMHQARALSEMVRVLCRAGILLLRVEGPGFDWQMIVNSRSCRDLLSRLYDCFLGLGLHVFGRQLVPGRTSVTGGRTFGTPRRIQKILRPACDMMDTVSVSQYHGLTTAYQLLASRSRRQ